MCSLCILYVRACTFFCAFFNCWWPLVILFCAIVRCAVFIDFMLVFLHVAVARTWRGGFWPAPYTVINMLKRHLDHTQSLRYSFGLQVSELLKNNAPCATQNIWCGLGWRYLFLRLWARERWCHNIRADHVAMVCCTVIITTHCPVVVAEGNYSKRLLANEVLRSILRRYSYITCCWDSEKIRQAYCTVV